MSATGQLPNLQNELPALSSLSSLQSLGSAVTSGVENAATLGTSGTPGTPSIATKYLTIGLGILFLAIGLVTLTRIHEPVIAAGKKAAREAAIATVTA